MQGANQDHQDQFGVLCLAQGYYYKLQLGDLRIRPATLRLVDDPLYLLSHSRR